jgi:hypothetical protein
MLTSAQHSLGNGDGQRGHGPTLPLLLAVATVLLHGCGGDTEELAPKASRQVAYPVVLPMASQVARMPGNSQPQANNAATNRWPTWSGQTAVPAAGQDRPRARSPWQGPPVGFGRDMAQGQLVWPQAQPQPEPPQFRPWEEEHAKDQAASTPRLVAPYDRLMGSSRRGGQQVWPGYHPGYPAYPAPGMGYLGTPGALGVGGPGMGWPWSMGMWPGW